MDNFDILIEKEGDYTIKCDNVIYRFVIFRGKWYAFKTKYSETILDIPIFDSFSDAIKNFAELDTKKIMETIKHAS